MDNNKANTGSALKDLAKLVRKDLKNAGYKASVRCSLNSMSECLNVSITGLSLSLEQEIAGEMDYGVILSGLISEAKEFNNCTRDAAGAIVDRHVSTDGVHADSRYVSVSSSAVETAPTVTASDNPMDDFNYRGSRHHY